MIHEFGNYILKIEWNKHSYYGHQMIIFMHGPQWQCKPEVWIRARALFKKDDPMFDNMGPILRSAHSSCRKTNSRMSARANGLSVNTKASQPPLSTHGSHITWLGGVRVEEGAAFILSTYRSPMRSLVKTLIYCLSGPPLS